MSTNKPCLSLCPECSPSRGAESAPGDVQAVCLQCGTEFLLPVTAAIGSAVFGLMSSPEAADFRSQSAARFSRLSPRTMASLLSVMLHSAVAAVLSLLYFSANCDEDTFVLTGKISGRVDNIDLQPVVPVLDIDAKPDNKPVSSYVRSATAGADTGIMQRESEIGLPAGIGGTGAGGSGGGLFSGTGHVRSLAYVVDASGSMEGERIERVLRELAISIESLREDQLFFVVFFNERTYPMMWPRIEKRLIRASHFNKQRVLEWARQVMPAEATQPQNALRMALELDPQLVFFLTDGQIPESAVRTVRQYKNRRTTVSSIGVGEVADNPLMERIAQIGRGAFRIARED